MSDISQSSIIVQQPKVDEHSGMKARFYDEVGSILFYLLWNYQIY